MEQLKALPESSGQRFFSSFNPNYFRTLVKLRDLLRDRLPKALLDNLVGAHDVIGDIAVINLPPSLLAYDAIIGQALLASNRAIRVAARRCQPLSGEYRLAPLAVIAGEARLHTIHRENGLRLAVDLEKVYFSPRSATERLRVARLAQPEEKVLVAFSGIAPLPLTLAAFSQISEVVGIEKNPAAHAGALASLQLNLRSARKIHLHCGDILDLASDFSVGQFDRMILPLPQAATAFLPVLLPLLRPGGHLHCYAFAEAHAPQPVITAIAAVCTGGGRRMQAVSAHPCGHCGLRLYRYCIDAQIC